MMRAIALALAISLASPGVAVAQEPEALAIPDLAELSAHVTSQWDKEWAPRFAREAGRDGRSAQLVRVEGATCELYSGHWPDCEIVISAHFGDGAVVTKTLSTMFDRDADGTLMEVIVMVYPHRPQLIDTQPHRQPLIDTQPVEVPPVN